MDGFAGLLLFIILIMGVGMCSAILEDSARERRGPNMWETSNSCDTLKKNSAMTDAAEILCEDADREIAQYYEDAKKRRTERAAQEVLKYKQQER